MPPRAAQKKTPTPKIGTRTSARSPKPPVKNETAVDSSADDVSKVEDPVKSDVSESIKVENGKNDEETKDTDSKENADLVEEKSEMFVEVVEKVVVETKVVEEVQQGIAFEDEGDAGEDVGKEKEIDENRERDGKEEEEEAGEGEEEEEAVEGEEEVEEEGAEGEKDGEGEEGEEGEGEEDEGDEEIHEVPEPVQERRKQKEYEVFVGGIDRDAVEEDLKKLFSEVGEVVEVRLAKKQGSQKNKGFAFVRFATVEQAKKAATELKFPKVKGKACGVTRNNDNETLHLGNICKTWTKDDLTEKLKAYELENLQDVHLIDDPGNKGMNRGYAFLEFSTHMDAVAACTKLQKLNVFLGTDVKAEVAFAKSAFEPDEEIMAQVKSVFLDSLPATWDEAFVIEQLKKFGEIEKVQLANTMRTAKRKDFGFVSFVTREAALACIEEVNRDGIGDGDKKVLVKASLRKPLQKRKPLLMGGWRGSIGRGRGGWGLRGRGIGRPYLSRPMGSWQSAARGRGGRSSFQGSEFKRGSHSFIGKYGARPVRDFERPAVAPRRARDPYLESRYYQDYPPSYSRIPPRGVYPEDYDPRFMDYESTVPSAQDYHTVSRPKRPYSSLDVDVLESRSFTRRARTSDLELGSGISSYDGYSRIVPDDRFGYEGASYASHGFGSRYLSGSGSSRSYY